MPNLPKISIESLKEGSRLVIRQIETLYKKAFRLSETFPKSPNSESRPPITHDFFDPASRPDLKVDTMLQRFLSKHN